MKPQITFLATVLLLGGGITAPAAEPAVATTQATNGLVEPTASSHRPSQLQARGNRIVNADGEIVRFKGLMIPDPGRLAGEGRYTRALFEAGRATGANVIRIPVHPQFWAKDTNYLAHYLDPAVKWAGELGLYVILDWHSIGNEVTGYAPQVPELFCHTDAMTTNFWGRVAAHFHADPQVVFEIFNEPQNISAADWRRCAGRLAGVIRAQGATQLIIVGGLNYGRELDWVLREPVAGDNLAYASHIFPSHPQSGWNHDFGNIAARYPVVITEWGFIDQQETPNPPDHYLSGDGSTYGNPFMSYLDARGIGWVACWYDEQWQPAMLLKGGAGYTAWGKYAARELKNGRSTTESGYVGQTEAPQGEESDDRWWPTQALPKAVVRTTDQGQFPEPRVALQMMVQSVAGLAAKSVNQRQGDELVWVNNGDGDLEKWYARLLAGHPGLATPGIFAPWDLVDRYAQRGLIKGYILYRRDKSEGGNHADRPGMNCSVNVATSLAGLLDGIIVDEDLEQPAKAHGLKLLLDVREKTQSWCFQTYQNQFNRRLLCFQDPRVPHVRDLAIAHGVFTVYGPGEPSRQALAWLEPLSPVLGRNCGDEFEITSRSTDYGDIQTATDWSLNLPVLMAGTEKSVPTKAASFDPRTIDWKDSRSAVSFIASDGDNVQWLEGNFFGNQSYWGNPARGAIPFGWSGCFAHLIQLCPEAIDYAQATRTTNDSLIEWGGGYYYPDHFGRGRTNRWELLAQHARRTWELMKKTNTRIIGFNFTQFDSPDAHQACEVFARQTDGLLAILAFQYSAYEAGAGETFWVKDRNGIEVPVISARYTIWEHANNRERAGTPAKVAREIRQTVEQTEPGQLPRYDWVIDHAWSHFKPAPGTDEDAENMQDSMDWEGVRGYSPAIWCAGRLPAGIRVVSPEELVWRIRMKHDSSQTRKLIDQFR